MFARAAGIVTLAFVCSSCSKTEASSRTEPSAAPSTTVDEMRDCKMCSLDLSTSGWFFINMFADASCRQPVAHSDFAACTDVLIPKKTKVQFVDPLGVHRQGENAEVGVVSQVVFGSAYRKVDGKCVPFDAAGMKSTPAGCSGRVCRNAAGELSCGACRKLPNGCNDYEGSRAYVVLDVEPEPSERKTTSATVTGTVAPPVPAKKSNADRLRQCCNQLSVQAKVMQNSPEGGQFLQVAAQCNAISAAVGPNGTAPEDGTLKTMILATGRNVPPVCAGF